MKKLLPRSLALCSTFIWGLVAAIIPTAYTQDPGSLSSSEWFVQLEQLMQVAKQHGFEVPPETVQELIRSIQQQESLHTAAQAEGPDTFALLSADIWKEVESPLSRTKGDAGIPFPDPSKMVWKPIPTPTQAELAATPPAMAYPSPTPYRFPPPTCSKAETTKEVFDPQNTEPGIRVDRLFIPEHLVPLDPQTAFGSEVEIVPYSANSGDRLQSLFRIYNVPCLPFRMRITKSTNYFDTGNNALKNYELDPNGKGEWSPVMFEKLYPGRKLPPHTKPAPFRKPLSEQRRR